MKRYMGVFLILGFICAGLYSVSAHATEKAFWPFSSKRFSPETPEPINIVSSKARKIETKPMKLYIDYTDRVLLINTGKIVQIILTSPTTSTRANGGVIGNFDYLVSRADFIFNNETGGLAGTTVDKKGTQFEVHIWFYKRIYHSLVNALNYRDGIMKIISPIIVKGNAPNPLFSLFVPYLKKVLNPRSSVEMSVIPAMAFFVFIPKHIQYYAYPGSCTNYTTGEQFYSAVTIRKEVLENRFMSIQQFKDTFGSMLNSEDEPLNTALPTFSSGDRPIISTTGIIEIPMGISQSSVKPGGI